eukprot:197343_1
MKAFLIAFILFTHTVISREPAQSETSPVVPDTPLDSEPKVCVQDGTDGQEACLVNEPHDDEPLDLQGDPETIRSHVRSKSARGIQIKSSRPYRVYYYWVNTRTHKGQYNGDIKPFGVTATVSYIGHEFYVVREKDDPQSKSLLNITVDGTVGSTLFIVPIDESEATESDRAYYDNLLNEEEWTLAYERRTGYPYLSYYDATVGGSGPRQRPILPFWPADFIGQKHRVVSNETYWHCVPDTDWTQEEIDGCRGTGTIEIDVEVIGLYPKMFKIMGSISDTEGDFVMNYARPALARSRAGQNGGMVTNTRTSFNTWIGRHVHPIIGTLYNRAADMLGIRRDQMRTNSEQLQVLHYDVGQEYSSHHDFGSAGSDKQRVMTLLFYLNDVPKGGETFFPKAMGEGIKVHPGKGNSALFYSILPDGNADDLSLHWALPVGEGEKWACNFWIWDPYRR